MATILDTYSKMLIEQLSGGIQESLPRLDPAFMDIKTSSIGVTRDGIGRLFKVIHTFTGSQGGGFSFQAPDGADVVFDGSTSGQPFTAYNSSSLGGFPGITESVNPGFFQKTITLKELRGNFFLPVHLLRVDQLDAAIGSAFRELIKSVAEGWAMSQINSWYKTVKTGTAGAGRIGTFTTPGSSEDISATAPGTQYTLASGRIRSLRPGMVVNIYDNGGNTLQNSSAPVYVGPVDVLGGTFYLLSASGAVNLTASTTYDIVPRGIRTASDTIASPAGLEDFVHTAATGTLYGINVAHYPHATRSLAVDLGGNPADSTRLNIGFAKFWDAYGKMLDTTIMSEPALVSILENIEDSNQLTRYEIQGEPLRVELGWSSIGYRYNGKLVELMVSPNVDKNTMYTLMLKGRNVMKYVPPRIPGTGAESSIDGELQFFGNMWGNNKIFWPVTNSSGGPTDFLQAPFTHVYNFCPKWLPGIKWSNVATAY